MKIEVPIYVIVIELGLPDPDTPGSFLDGVIIEGSLRENCDCFRNYNKRQSAPVPT